MRLEDLRPTPGAMKKRKRVGRGPGSGCGKMSGRGNMGQKSRGEVHPWFEGGQTPLHRRLPKRGFKSLEKKIYAVVNVGVLNEKFEANEEVTPQKLLERGIIRDLKDGVKILGDGDLTKPLTVRAHAFSKTAREKIEGAGGKIEVI